MKKPSRSGTRKQVEGKPASLSLASHLPLSGILLVAILLLLGACASEPDLEQPPDILYGEDGCDRCSMIINEARFAAAYVTVEGETRRFDDIGGMLRHDEDNDEEVAAYWVHDYETEEWLKADKAHYVANEGLITPMGFGIIAFATRDAAEIFAEAEGGKVMDFSTLKSDSAAAVLTDHNHEE